MRIIIGFIAFFFFFVRSVFAQGYTGVEYCDPPINRVVKSAIGCIPNNPSLFMKTLFDLAIGIAGGVAFLMLLLGAIQIQTSAGNPERVAQGRELIEGAITGLLLIIFSVFILKFVGVDILSIPGFS